jgi:hypothetical protein
MTDTTTLVTTAMSAFGGTLAGFGLTLGLDAWRGRFLLSAERHGVAEQVFVSRRKVPDVHFVVTEPADAQIWVVTIDLAVINPGYRPDALLSVAITGGFITEPVRARTRADEAFRGITVGPHSIEPVRARFFLSPSHVRCSFEEMAAGSADGSVTLTFESSRRQLMNLRNQRRMLKPRDIPMSEFGEASFTPGEQIRFLHHRSAA